MRDNNAYDAVVIGSGLGGLTAGALLAKWGRKVLVLERNFGLGGAASCYRFGQLTIEASLHETADPRDPRDLKHRVLEHLGLMQDIEWVAIPSLHRIIGGPIGDPFDLPHGFAAAGAAVSDRFPEARGGIARFLGRMEALYDTAGRLNAASESRSLRDLVSATTGAWPIFRDWRLSLHDAMQRDLGSCNGAQCALAANLAYYADDPRRTWWLFFAMAQAGYLGSGGVYVRGGSTLLSRSLAKSIKKSGGDVLLGRAAERIEIGTNGRPTAVHHMPRKGGVAERVSTRVVLANTAPHNLAAMLPEPAARTMRAHLNDRPLSISLFCAHFGMRSNPANFGLKSYSTILLPSWMTKLEDYAAAASLLADLPNGRMPPLTVVNYGAIDSGLTAPGEPILVTVAGVDRLENWENVSQAAYETRRTAWLDAITATLEDHFPGFAGQISERTMLTASSTRQYLATPGGAIYGFAPEPPRTPPWRGFPASPRTPLPGVFLASSFAGAGGYTGAMGAGAHAARLAHAEL